MERGEGGARRIVPGWFAAATACAGAILVALALGWVGTPERRSRPAARDGDPRIERIRACRIELRAARRSLQRKLEALASLARTEAQVRSGKYPRAGGALIPRRREELVESIEAARAQCERREARLEALLGPALAAQ